MREVTGKSMKLNRDLEKMLTEALQRDLLVRIGWGRGGDEKPKNGEIGVITHLPPKSRVLLLGDLGECAGAMNRGGTLTLQGGCTSMAGAFQAKGRLIIEKDAGNRIGANMSGGTINVNGSVGKESGSSMKGGLILVRGHAGDRVGAGMHDGTIIVLGSVGSEPGVGMRGGRIIVAGSCPPPGDGATMRGIEPEEIIDISEYLEPLGLSINEDALVLFSDVNSPPIGEQPECSIIEGFEGIAVVPTTQDRLASHSPLDPYTLILPPGEDKKGLLFPVPWLIEGSGTEISGPKSAAQPSLVSENPREIDLLLIDEDNLVGSVDSLRDCAGIVLNLANLPVMNDAEIEGLLVSLSSKIQNSALVMLRDRVDRVDHLFRLVVELDLDGAIIDASSPGGGRAAAALPKIGLAARAMDLINQERQLMIELDEPPSAEDCLIARGAGCSIVVAPAPDENLEEYCTWLDSTIRGWMRELGIDGIEAINRKNLRAMDYDTAAITGLRLIGFDRPLPIWLGN